MPPLRVIRATGISPGIAGGVGSGVAGFVVLLLVASRDPTPGPAAVAVLLLPWLCLRWPAMWRCAWLRGCQRGHCAALLMLATRQLCARPGVRGGAGSLAGSLALGCCWCCCAPIWSIPWRKATPPDAPNRFVINAT